MLRGRRSIVRASRCFSISTPPPPPLNLSSRCRFYPLAITPAPCCDSIARFFRINLAASYKSTCLQQRDTPSRDIYIYTGKEDPSIRGGRPFLSFTRSGVDLDTLNNFRTFPSRLGIFLSPPFENIISSRYYYCIDYIRFRGKVDWS